MKLVCDSMVHATLTRAGTVTVTNGHITVQNDTMRVAFRGVRATSTAPSMRVKMGSVSLSGRTGASIVGNAVVLATGKRIRIPSGASVTVNDAGVFINGERADADEAPAEEPVERVMTMIVDTPVSAIEVHSATLVVEEGAPLAASVSITQTGTASLNMKAHANAVSVTTSGAAKCAMTTLPTQSLTVHASGASKVSLYAPPS